MLLCSGHSRRTNKPYAIATVEDLKGTFQVLCMNENYDKYPELLLANRTVLVIGEANNSESTPKIFPQEIIPLDDAPAKFTRQVQFRVNGSELGPEKMEALLGLATSHTGRCPLFLRVRREDGRLVYLDTSDRYFVRPSEQLRAEVNELLGSDSYYAMVDTTLPEPAKRSWPRSKPTAAESERFAKRPARVAGASINDPPLGLQFEAGEGTRFDERYRHAQ
ncbi:MAG: hypothetical protein CM1200mP34_4690 [Verrucomicrobiales bacterium]|nr:MAG: hypothetical protein CM1200mP34_4690 [Verrucomicrobiales bacterium]